jgi:hypothetical protein
MPASPERRAEERFPVTADTSCSFISPVVEDFGPAKVQNVSMTGIGLVLTRRVEVGSLLAICLVNPARGFARTVLVRLTHVTAQPGGYLVGGTLSPALTYQELTTLVM